MKITKNIEMEVMGVHNLFWESYARRDIEIRFSLCSEDVTFIGSGLHERALNKTEYKNINKKGVKQFPDPFQIEFLWTNLSMLNEVVACVESEVVWSQLINDEMTKELLRNTTLLKRDKSKWLVTHVHGSVPDYRLKDGDYMTNEQTIIRNRELERQVFERTRDLNKTLEELGQKNRELEIEGALEKVRTIAMGMRKPVDMLDVCKTISLQLQSLGVKEIRNVQTAIFYEQRGNYMNYEYYSMHDKTIITETVFTNNEIHNEFATKMMRGKGETFITHIKGSKVKDWIAYQKTTNVFIDKYLETASSLNYFWFSLGPVALGISTYVPLTEDEINLFKRFLKVFELAYQRYLDIEIAEAQAREAQIEVSLERVRAVAMGMNKSDDLLSICEVSFKEFKKLGFDNIRNALIHIQYDNQKYFMDYDFSDLTGGAITKIEYGSHPVVEDYLKQIRSAKDAFYQGVIKEDQLEEWKDFRRNSGQIDDPRLDKATALYYYFFSIGKGDIGISTLKSIDESQIKILKRFRNVFDLAYRRYGDIALAEAQARESQIELALERVRARTMAMQRSEELRETSFVLFEQMRKLGETAEQLSIGIFNENRSVIELSITLSGSKLSNTYEVPFDEPFLMGKVYQAWKAKKKSFVYELSGKTLKDYNQYRNRVLGGKLSSKEKSHTKRIVYFAFFSKGLIGFSSHEERSSETILLIERFAGVFDLTYTRFNDLKKAEAQAKEAKIEAALEKVRAAAMSMNKPDDLLYVCEVLFTEFHKLGFDEMRNAMINIHNDEKETFINYDYSDAIGRSINHLTYNIHPVIERQIKQIRSANDAFSETSFTGTDLEEWKKFRNKIGEKDDQRINNITALYYYFYSIGTGSIGISTFNPIDENKLELLKRFRNVFSLSYQRYSDIAQAEAQAREAQIEAALERVRSRTMGMQKSEELKEVIQIVYEQFVHFDVLVEHAGFIMDYKVRDDMQIWLADKHEVPFQVTIPYFDSPHWNSFIEAKEKKIDFFTNHLTFEEKNKFYKELFKFFPVPDEAKEYYFNCPGLAISTVLLDNVGLYIENFSGIPYTDEENNTLMRFGKVFQQTYTRFLDLQKAEAQAREAEIELSLERVRSRAMAMHSPNDLSETVNVFFKELKTLGIIPIRCGVGQIDEATRITSLTTTTSSQQGESFQVIGKVKQTGHPVLDGIFDHWKLQKEYHPVLEGEDIKAYYNVMNAQIGYPDYPEEVTQYGNSFFFKEGFVFAWTENLLSEEELIIFRRFTSVLSLTYRRYLDLKEAEERNNIIQAENDRKSKELEDARLLQLSMLPKELPELHHLDIAVYMKTATEVGGDYYDFNIDINGWLTVVLGDATGHGMLSGMMVSIMKSFFISHKTNIELKQFFETTNNSIKDMQLGRLMMPLMGVQITSAKIIATNAGMPSLIYFRNKSQKAGEFVSHNMPLGAMKGTKYLLKEINYEKGDTLLLMSDGFAELKNENNEQYGYPRIIEEFRSIAQKNSNEIVEHLKNSASEWINGIEPDDDVTFVVIKVK